MYSESARQPAGISPEQQVDGQDRTHFVQFYSDDKFLLDTLSRFMGSAIGAGDVGVVIATEEHRRELASRLSARGLDLERAVEQGRYVALDAAETLDRCMVDGLPDETRFVDVIGGVINRAETAARREGGRPALFGEMVALLWSQGNTGAAIELERLWNRMSQSHSFSLMCAYPLSDFARGQDPAEFERICAEHAVVLPADAPASEEERNRLIVGWQQRAHILEADLIRGRDAQAAAARLAAIVESSEDAIASKDLNGIITSWNAGAERIFGYTAEEIIGKPVTTIIPPELHPDEDVILSRIRRGERIEHFETVRLTKSGNRVDISLTVSPIKDASGRVIGAAKIARDITERKRAQEVLRRAEKLAVTGRMAATIAHEINNPLEAVTNLLYLLRSHVSGQEGRERLALAESELSRVSHITKQTLAFYREGQSAEPVALPDVLDGVMSILANKISRKQVRITRRFQPCVVRAMKGELRQLFSNLIDNAIDAVPTAGEIGIAVECTDAQAVVSISDNGPGIAAEHLTRLFEPFFTTKQVGTGLGLWVVQEIAEKHGGKITVESNTDPGNHGTTFHVALRAMADSGIHVAA
jgi:PAS domain S-box-containing protein